MTFLNMNQIIENCIFCNVHANTPTEPYNKSWISDAPLVSNFNNNHNDTDYKGKNYYTGHQCSLKSITTFISIARGDCKQPLVYAVHIVGPMNKYLFL